MMARQRGRKTAAEILDPTVGTRKFKPPEGIPARRARAMRRVFGWMKSVAVVAVAAVAVVLAAGPAEAHDSWSGTVGVHTRARASCFADSMMVLPPRVYAVNAVSGVVESQQVAFYVNFQLWNGSSWSTQYTTYNTRDMLYGNARDDMDVQFWFDWSGSTRSRLDLRIPLRGHWRVQGVILWNPTQYVGNSRDTSRANHYLSNGAGPYAYCSY
jgi:hypothetical protein